MKYIARLNKEHYFNFKKKKGDFTIGYRINSWIEELGNPELFLKVVMNGCKELNPSDVVFSKMGTGVSTQNFNVTIDRSIWTKFKNNCRKYNVSGNLVLNLLIIRYLESGEGLIEKTIKI